MVKKGFIVLGSLILFLCLLGAIVVWYVKPDEHLNLEYSQVSLSDRFVAMAKNLQTSLVLTETDMNNIGKAYIAANDHYGRDVTITGARFRFQENRIVAQYDLSFKNRIPVELVVYYRVTWREPNLVAVVDEVKVKGLSLPNRYVGDITLPIGDMVPKPLHIRGVELRGNELLIQFKKPTFSELAQLLKRELGL